MSGPSGVGKSSVVDGLADRLDFAFSVSMTTRARRPDEVDGVDYHFVSDEEFDDAIAANSLVEWARYGDHRYGTPARAVEETLQKGTDVLLDIEIVGSGNIKQRYPDAIMIWIEPPGWDELERRLRSRGDTSEDDILQRLELARDHSETARGLFEHFVVNDRLEVAIDTVTDILGPVPRPPVGEA